MKRIIGFLCIAALPLLAATPVATVTGPGTEVNGKPLQTAGAPNWPVGPGDEIIAGPEGAHLILPDGTNLALAAGTRVSFKTCGVCVAQLFSGAVNYSKPAGSKFEMCALGHPVRPDAGRGSVVVQSAAQVLHTVGSVAKAVVGDKCACNAEEPWRNTNQAAQGGSHAKLIALTAAGAGGTAVGLGVASAKGGKGNDYNPPGQSRKN